MECAPALGALDVSGPSEATASVGHFADRAKSHTCAPAPWLQWGHGSVTMGKLPCEVFCTSERLRFNGGHGSVTVESERGRDRRLPLVAADDQSLPGGHRAPDEFSGEGAPAAAGVRLSAVARRGVGALAAFASGGAQPPPQRPQAALRDTGVKFILETCSTLFNYAQRQRHLAPYAENSFHALELGGSRWRTPAR